MLFRSKPGEHGSTYGGNPMACRVAMTAMSVVIDEKLSENAAYLGQILLSALKNIQSPLIHEVRGKGLFCAIDMHHDAKISAWDVCMKLRDRGLLAKPTHDHIIRFAPPLVITEEQLLDCINIITTTFNEL